jgi:hypothetical protein
VWVNAQDLQVGDEIVSTDGDVEVVEVFHLSSIGVRKSAVPSAQSLALFL